MRLLILSKRRYTGKDLLEERYGRVFELSRALARFGHDVRGIALDYHGGPLHRIIECEGEGRLEWVGLKPEWAAGYLWRSYKLGLEAAPDVLISVSDVYHVIYGGVLAWRVGSRHVSDLYDDYAAFGASRIPGIRSWYRETLRRADAITCGSEWLASEVNHSVRPGRQAMVLTNAVNRQWFRPMDRVDCRSRLGLPISQRLVGTGGALHRNRGIDALFDAYAILRGRSVDCELVLAGPKGPGVQIPDLPGVHYLGVLPYEKMPLFFNALDVGVIANIDSPFGRTCFPQKLYELLACETAVVASRVGPAADLLRACPDNLYSPGDSVDLERAIRATLASPCRSRIRVPDWAEKGAEFEALLRRVMSAGKAA